jgi:homocysteine S-methyltransferase
MIMALDFLADIKDRILLADGAMGTMLYAKGVYINTCFDELNLSRPALVEEIHREYIEAGADIIETNTFGANFFKLSSHGLLDHFEDINRRGGEIARGAAGDHTYVAASIGPIGRPLKPIGKISHNEARDAFAAQARILDPFVDLFIIETIPSSVQMKTAVEAVRSVSNRPIVAQLTFGESGDTLAEERPESAVKELENCDFDVLGCNCSIGPQPMLRVVEKLRSLTDRPLSVQPNAGSPREVENRYIYLSSPEYMAEYAKRFIMNGVSIVGGCCGTTPAHIRMINSAIKALRPVTVKIDEPVRLKREAETLPPVPFAERSRLANNVGKKFVISVEIDPPRGLVATKALDGARLMYEHGVDAINIADGPRASARMSPMSLAALMEQKIGIETILHYCCRDRNLLGMQADLIGAHMLGIRNILIITGDPPKLGDYPSATAVFDVDSIGLVQIVKNMNHGLDLGANPLGGVTRFAIGVGANPGAIDMEREIRRFHEKVEAGAEYCLTQPVYDAPLLEKFLDATKDADIPILVGILPLTSHKNAEFLHYEVPGMQIPEHVRNRMKKTPSGAKAKAVGVEIAREALRDCKTFDRVKGAYIMPPFGRYDAVLKIIEGI